MIAEDIPQLAELYRQFWDEKSCIETMYKKNLVNFTKMVRTYC